MKTNGRDTNNKHLGKVQQVQLAFPAPSRQHNQLLKICFERKCIITFKYLEPIIGLTRNYLYLIRKFK